MKRHWYYDSPVGKLGVVEEDEKLIELFFDNGVEVKDSVLEEGGIIKETGKQLEEYFSKKRKKFDIPMSLKGTAFQKSCWDELCKIEYGSTCCYQDIAIAIGNPKAVRAVGMSNNRNPIVIVVPCHRVVGKNGSLVGFGGGLPTKSFLLELEQKVK